VGKWDPAPDPRNSVRAPIYTKPAKFTGSVVQLRPGVYSVPIFTSWNFPMHQIAEIQGHIYDPMLEFGSEDAPLLVNGISRSDYYNWLVEIQPAVPEPSGFHKPEFPLKVVKMPKWAPQL